ncbi:M61 family metallopeptidase [Fulvivirga sp. 29W222]|uniref:M61 family metallopeptidase n=1 Tax=Fulvivirga marina TaxID=2494733 RepID=A0A937FUV3_9BACT|nr:M61 family metallopeptidase [Fulvivirga marina]MBL6446364.1 M61 family metallopeptidase [Fulvivirga marina]
MNYFINFKNPLTHFFSVRLELDHVNSESVLLELPIWRPGRYEAANFAKNIRGFKIENEKGQPLGYTKVNPSTWKVESSNTKSVIISYDYFAFKMDAGNSWYDASHIYINFINCMIYDVSRLNNPCQVSLNVPENYQIACGLKRDQQYLLADNYYELVDSPLMAGANLEHYQYDVESDRFHIWIHGEHPIKPEKLVDDFKKFTQAQVKEMNEFPEKEYHFLLELLPYKLYHGVEHHDSTVICLGPGHALDTEEMYSQLLGVSSHELFHAWNIIKIRPEEMMPYQFNRPVTFPTGFVAEGFTTYYGDLFLARSEVFDRQWYFSELNTLFRRHFSNYGRLNYSVFDSSLDLWIDGYTISTPERKSSIYVEGAMVALCLDLMIRKKSSDKRSLDDVMRSLWKSHGKTGTGYSYQNIQSVCEDVYGADLSTFFNSHVKGTEPKKSLINDLLYYVGCQLLEKDSENDLEKYFGIRMAEINDSFRITQIAPGSIAESHFSLNDEILTINDQKLDIENINQFDADNYEFLVRRNYKDITIKLKPGQNKYFHQYNIVSLPEPSAQQKASFEKWTGCKLD